MLRAAPESAGGPLSCPLIRPADLGFTDLGGFVNVFPIRRCVVFRQTGRATGPCTDRRETESSAGGRRLDIPATTQTECQ